MTKSTDIIFRIVNKISSASVYVETCIANGCDVKEMRQPKKYKYRTSIFLGKYCAFILVNLKGITRYKKQSDQID